MQSEQAATYGLWPLPRKRNGEGLAPASQLLGVALIDFAPERVPNAELIWVEENHHPETKQPA
jgi:hypothetical protein